ncbi:Protein of unknown function [Gryllus bimaculatus]|nr:Protein of unknown function [Gryllus bimaculatus]
MGRGMLPHDTGEPAVPQNAPPHPGMISDELKRYLSLGKDGKPLLTTLSPASSKPPSDDAWASRDYLELPPGAAAAGLLSDAVDALGALDADNVIDDVIDDVAVDALPPAMHAANVPAGEASPAEGQSAELTRVELRDVQGAGSYPPNALLALVSPVRAEEDRENVFSR